MSKYMRLLGRSDRASTRAIARCSLVKTWEQLRVFFLQAVFFACSLHGFEKIRSQTLEYHEKYIT